MWYTFSEKMPRFSDSEARASVSVLARQINCVEKDRCIVLWIRYEDSKAFSHAFSNEALRIWANAVSVENLIDGWEWCYIPGTVNDNSAGDMFHDVPIDR